MSHPQADIATSILAIDHLALRVADRDAIVVFLCEHLGMRETKRTEELSALGPPGERARLVIHAAGEATEPGALGRVVLRVADLEHALSRLPDGLAVDRVAPELVEFEGPEGLRLGLTWVPGGGVDYDLDHVVLRVAEPDETTFAFAELGFVPRAGSVQVAGRSVRLEPGAGSAAERPMLSHIGVLVESAGAVEAQARRAGLELDERTHRPNKLAVVLRGPERIRLEYADTISEP